MTILSQLLVLRDELGNVVGTAPWAEGLSEYGSDSYKGKALLALMRPGDNLTMQRRRLSADEVEAARRERAELDRQGEEAERAEEIVKLEEQIRRLRRTDELFKDEPIVPVSDADITF